MRKLIIAALAISGITAQAGVAADRFQLQPEGSAFVAFDFGRPRTSAPAVRFGLALNYQRSDLQGWRAGSRFSAVDATRLPLLSLTMDPRGDAVAAVNGLPFARRFAQLNQEEGGGGHRGGLTVVDWGLLVVGLGGIGYAISQVANSNDSPNPNPPSSAGSSTGSGSGTGSGGLPCLPGVTCFAATSVSGAPITGYDRVIAGWLDAGDGQMGDLTR